MKLIQCLLLAGATMAATAASSTHRELSFTGEIASLRLVSADTDKGVVTLFNNTVITVSSSTTPSFNLNTTVRGNVASIKFGHNANRNVNIDHGPLFAFCGNSANDFFRCNLLGLGRHTITATPYSKRDAAGVAGRPYVVTFTIVAGPAPTPVAKVTPAPIKAPTAAPIKAPITAAPVTKAPVTAAPVTKAPVTTKPTLAPVTAAPVTKAPVTKAPVTAEPTLAPVTAAPVTKAPVTTEPTLAPVTAAPVTKAPVTADPTSAPATKAPRSKAPVTDEPTSAPVTNAPRSKAPVTDEPTPAPVTKAPKSSAPVSAAPVTSPTALEGCYLREISTGLETLLTGSDVYDINRVVNPDGFSIRCDVNNMTDIVFIKFLYSGIEHDEFGPPRWLDGDNDAGAYVNPVAYLATCGPKTVTVQGNNWSGVQFEKTYSLTATCPVTKAPTPKAPAAPVAPISAPTALEGCYLREISTGLETLLTGSDFYDVNRVANPDGFSIRCDVNNMTDIVFIKFLYSGIEHDEFGPPRWLDGDNDAGAYVNPVAYLATCGPKTITVQGNNWSGVQFEKTYSLTATCPVTKAPTTKAPVAPVTRVPTLAPAPTPFAGITTFELIYTGRLPHASVMNLVLGQVNVVNLNMLRLPANAKFSVNAVQNQNSVKSVTFSNGRNETSLPWAMCGNSDATYYDCPNLVAGATVNITVLPFPERGTRGTPFPMVWAVVQILEGTLAPTISPAPSAAPNTKRPTNAPAVPPPTAPVTPPPPIPQNCSLPRLVGSWASGKSHYPVAEAQGAMIGKYHVIVGGFLAGYESVSTQTHVLDTSSATATWQRMDDYPFAIGVTHGAFVVVGQKFYMCGGYAGGGIGMHTDICMVYDHSKPPGVGQQWSIFTPLPGGGRAGGGMVYDSRLNALIFSAGATRPIPQKRTALDHNNTWMYSLVNPTDGWVPKAPMPFLANHMSSVTAYDADGNERHYFTGGQKGEDEHDGNQAEHFEYDAVNDVWSTRQFMTIPRSHAASSTRAIGCGFIMVAGCTNDGQKISDISYYDASADTWTKIGDLSSAVNTPVCGISNGVLYCDTGWDSGRFSKKIGITL